MNYRHAYHAGNFADVFKHLLLVRLLRALQRKDRAFAYIETHAGSGRYDLAAAGARGVHEHREGIGRLWNAPREADEDFEAFVAAVRAVNRGEELRRYPGSPRIARFFLRPQDRMRVCEMRPDECARLRAEFAGDAQVTVRCGDGYAALAAWLPPPERRGLVLIDPPYERPDEWDRAREALLAAAKRWPQGIYAVWYPLKAGAPTARLRHALARSGLRKLLCVEMRVWPADTPFRLNGSGMLLHNPPWRFDVGLEARLAALAERLRQGPEADARVEWLVPE